MADMTLAGFKDRYAEIDRRLDAELSDGDRASVKAEIIGLFRTVEQAVAELTALKEEIRTLVAKWKAQEAAASLAPPFAGGKPAVHADHIGASTFVEKGWSRLSLGDFAGAEAALSKAVELSPGDPRSEALLGWAQMSGEKYDEALVTFRKVLSREPSNTLAMINVGFICLKKRTFGEAIEHLSQAIRLDNDKKATLYAHFYLGLVYLEREMYEDAQTFFRKALALGPNLIEAYYEMGRAYWFNGRKHEAIDAWRLGLAANRYNSWAKRCAELLERVDAGGEPSRT
ncbi:MAG TPA: tetratricopeptide repeat protein [Gemmatimonadaceae bacterium]